MGLPTGARKRLLGTQDGYLQQSQEAGLGQQQIPQPPQPMRQVQPPQDEEAAAVDMSDYEIPPQQQQQRRQQRQVHFADDYGEPSVVAAAAPALERLKRIPAWAWLLIAIGAACAGGLLVYIVMRLRLRQK